jgi:hypothetical protein
MLRDLHAMSQSVERIAAGQEQITRTVDQIATRIAAGQQQTTRTTDQTSTSVGQASYADPSSIAVEGRADRASSQPMVRLDIKRPRRDRRRHCLKESCSLWRAGMILSCLPSASAVLQNHPGGWPSWTLKAAGHEGTVCWYAAARSRASDRRPQASGHRREMMPSEKEVVGITENGLSAPPASYTRAPE